MSESKKESKLRRLIKNEGLFGLIRVVNRKLKIKFYKLYNHRPFNNRFSLGNLKGGGNTLSIGKGTLLKRVKIFVFGKNNKISIGKMSALTGCAIYVYGNDNTIDIKDDVLVNHGEIVLKNGGNVFTIDNGSKLCGKVHFSCFEGTKISVGKDCLFSNELVIRTGDAHTVLDLQGNRCNFSKDVTIGDHVWIGSHVIMEKGSAVADNCIIASGAVVTKRFETSNVVIGGVPAGIIKKDINWDRELLLKK